MLYCFYASKKFFTENFPTKQADPVKKPFNGFRFRRYLSCYSLCIKGSHWKKGTEIGIVDQNKKLKGNRRPKSRQNCEGENVKICRWPKWPKMGKKIRTNWENTIFDYFCKPSHIPKLLLLFNAWNTTQRERQWNDE